MEINKYISINNKKNDIVEIDIYGDIVDKKLFDEDVTVKGIRDELKKYDNVKTLEIHGNSDGGSVGAGNGIISIIDAFKKRTNCFVESYIEGMCASMASGIMMCADKIYMADNALLIIHKPLMNVQGNANDFQQAIDFLNKAETTLLKNYRRHWKGTEEELQDALAATSIYTAEEALELGLCDEIIPGVKIAASIHGGIKIGNQNFSKEVSDLIKDKYPQITLEKEVRDLEFDTKLENYGIDKELFDSLGMENDKIMQIVNAVKGSEKPATVEQFICKEKALEVLGVKDLTGEEILDYAKAGMNMPDINAIQNKANDYDRIVESARKEALTSANRAKGDMFNEARIKKMLDALDYEDIIEQTKEWNEEAKMALHAGNRVSVPKSELSNKKENIKAEDYNV